MPDLIKLIMCVMLLLICFSTAIESVKSSNCIKCKPFILPVFYSVFMFFSVAEWIWSGRFKIPNDEIFVFYILLMAMGSLSQLFLIRGYAEEDSRVKTPV